MKNETYKFLETFTLKSKKTSLHIDKIKHVHIGYEGGTYEILITTEDGSYAECFGRDEKEGNKRYEQIKRIIHASSHDS